MGAKIQGRGVSGTPAKFAGYFKSSYPEDFATPAGARRPPSETFSGAFWSFPSPRKRSAARFDTFRGLGNVQRRVLELSDPSETFSGVF